MSRATTSLPTSPTTACSAVRQRTHSTAARSRDWAARGLVLASPMAPAALPSVHLGTVIADRFNGRVVLCPAAFPGSDCTVMVQDLSRPRGVRVLKDGSHLIADSFNHRVLLCRLSNGSTCETVAGGSDQLETPSEAVMDDNGVDTFNHRVPLCSTAFSGSVCSTVDGTGGEGSGATQLIKPRGIAIIATSTTARLRPTRAPR